MPTRWISSHYHGFEVLLDSAAELKKNTKFQIEALISGQPPGRGNNGFKAVGRCGVLFTFSSSDSQCSNRKNRTRGQFPDLFFVVL